MRMKTNPVFNTLIVIVTLSIIISLSSIVISDPTGPQIDVGIPQRGASDSSSGTNVQAQGGNMTALTLNASILSQRWQGYYGNLTGRIALDNGAGDTMYSWIITTVSGEIYASNDSNTPTWANVMCFNFSKTSLEQNVTLSNLQASLGMNPTDDDTVNKTFNLTYTGSFTIGTSNTISEGDGCMITSLNVNDNPDQISYNETILTDNSTRHMIIYTMFIERNTNGFTNTNLDFQMIVGDNSNVVAATDYYFYVELD